MPDTPQELVILTGMSGAGRSTAAKSLEDMGWYVVDNLPPTMLRPLIELASAAGSNMPRIAAVFVVFLNTVMLCFCMCQGPPLLFNYVTRQEVVQQARFPTLCVLAPAAGCGV